MKIDNLREASTVPGSKDQTATISEHKLTKHINLDKWEDAGYSWQGTITPQELNRLANTVADGYLRKPIDVNFEIKKDSQLLVVTMDFSGSIWVICQRCLEPVEITVDHHNELILLEDEDQESLVDEADDYLLLAEVLSNYEGNIQGNKHGERLLPIAKLIEDELLLEVPLSAKHEDCEVAVEQVGEIIEEETESPFAALAELKGKL